MAKATNTAAVVDDIFEKYANDENNGKKQKREQEQLMCENDYFNTQHRIIIPKRCSAVCGESVARLDDHRERSCTHW